MTHDLISRTTVRMAVGAEPWLSDATKKVVRDIINRVPAVAKAETEGGLPVRVIQEGEPELVHCKDCYYWLKAKVNRSGGLVCPKSRMEIMATDFCSKAEKRRCKYDK